MAREIDVKDPSKLSLEDRMYLQDRGRLPEGADPVPGKEYWSQGGETVLVATATGTARVSEKDAESLRDPHKDEEGDEDDTPYSEWSLADLQAEADARKLPKGGSKADLVARLEKDDEV